MRTSRKNLYRLTRIRRSRFVAITCGVAVLAGALTPGAHAEGTIADLHQGTSAAFLRSFIKSCVDGFRGSNFGKSYCPCAAAFVADRFSVDEASDAKIMGSGEAMDDAHPGIMNLMKVCAIAAKPAT